MATRGSARSLATVVLSFLAAPACSDGPPASAPAFPEAPGTDDSGAGAPAGERDAAATSEGDLSPDDAMARAREIVDGFCTDAISSDPTFCKARKKACLSGTPRTPYLARDRMFVCTDPGCGAFEDRGTYYLVPFDLPDGTTPCIVAVSSQLRGRAPGEHLETRWGDPIRYLPIAETAAAEALRSHLAALGRTPPTAVPAPDLVDYPATKECGWSLDFPMWTYAIGDEEWFVDQQGFVHDEIVSPLRGGGGPPLSRSR